MEGSRGGHDIMNVSEEKGLTFNPENLVSRKDIFQARSREETSFTSLTTTLFRPPVDPGSFSMY